MTVPVPVVQAGMGVQVAKSALAAAVSKAGAIGCISSVGLGTLEGSLSNYIAESNEKLAQEIRAARRLAPGGALAVNVMCALFNYEEIVKVCVREGVDIIISGAGLPMNLPELTKGSPVRLVPVVSSGRTMSVIVRAWTRKYNRMPDAVIVEGPLCGGHMGFAMESLLHPETAPIEGILREVREVLAPFEAEYGRRVPVLGAEAIATPDDVLAMIAKGFDGAQVGTRFICTEEAGIALPSKEVYVKARDDDVVIIKSPIGLPVKVLRTSFVERILRNEKIDFGCPFLCLKYCKAKDAHFCLAEALVHTLFGQTDKGLFMVGSAIGRINDIIPAASFIAPLAARVR